MQSRNAVCVPASLAVSLLAVLWAIRERRKCRQLKAEAVTLAQQAATQLKLRDEERRGRTRAEQRLREVARDVEGSASESSDGFVLRPIGTLHSCYRARLGTPRQGGIVADSLAVLKCSRDLNPAAALQGLSEFSHCWVLYVFHENTNLQREGRTVANRQQRRGRVPPWQGLCMKVSPPRCPDLKVGVLACRTPHRPNPLGLSLAQIISVDSSKGEITLAGLDVVDGSPCVDVKPYLPNFEAITSASVPSWVQASYDEALMQVTWSEIARSQFARALGEHSDNSVVDDDDDDDADDDDAVDHDEIQCAPFATAAALRAALEGTLALDIRSPVQKVRHRNPGVGRMSEAFFSGDLWFHELYVSYSLLPCEASAVGSDARVRIDRVQTRSTALQAPR